MHVARVRCGERLVYVLVAFDDGQTVYMYNGGIDPEAKDTSPGVTGAAMYFQDRIAAGRRRFRLPARPGALQVRVGRRRRADLSCPRGKTGGREGRGVIRVDGMERIVVTELMASGAGGGAQVHVQSLVERLDRARFDVEVVTLSDGPAVRRIRATGGTVHVIDEPDDALGARAIRWTC